VGAGGVERQRETERARARVMREKESGGGQGWRERGGGLGRVGAAVGGVDLEDVRAIFIYAYKDGRRCLHWQVA
jgi:hypothetical protein